MHRQRKIRIHQFHSGSALGDAITNAMFFIQSMLQELGFESEVFSQYVDPGLRNRIKELENLRPDSSDILLLHHSMGHDIFSRLAALHCRKVLIYHNITPPEYFSKDDSTRAYAIKGYAQLSLFREIVEATIADSSFNAQQLIRRGFENVRVIPLLKDFSAIRHLPHSKKPYYDEIAVFRILFVGRIVAHKCQHELIEFVDVVRSIMNIPISLVLAGHFDPAYKQRLDEMLGRMQLGRQVKFTGPVDDAELYGWYRAANAYISLSDHEGFGVPLLEAMAFDLPVIAYATGAVPETMGGAGILLTEKDPARILAALTRLQEDRPYRTAVVRSQRDRLSRFSAVNLKAELCDWLIGLGVYDSAAARSGPEHPLPDPAASIGDKTSAPGRTHYIIEGPYETSYSLAIVNRNIALALNRGERSFSYIEPADGTEDYAVDAVAAGGMLPEIRKLVRPVPPTSDRIVTIRNTYPPRPNGMLGDLRLMHLAWEESSLPNQVAGLVNLHVDAVLAPSEYTKRAIRNSGVRVPIAVIGHGIDHSGVLPQVLRGRTQRGPVTHSLPFTFLHISSGLQRKGIEELLTAYCLAFSSRDPVLLVIKTFDNPDNKIPEWVARLTRASEYSPAIQIITEELDQHQMNFLYHAGDTLVLPSRGEGFNLAAAEGLAHGTPLITTRHSGHLDFCNDNNSTLIDCTYELSTSHLNITGSYWARASIDQLVRAMKTAYREGRSAQMIMAVRAAQAQRDVSQLRWHHVAAKIDDLVDYLDRRPVMNRQPRLAWLSTYNARCGIAAHSAHLLEFFDPKAFAITIIADDQEPVGPDPDNIVRLWSKHGGGLARVRNFIMANDFDAVFLQHNADFYDFRDFSDTLIALSDAHIQTFVTFHRTKDLERRDRLVTPQQMAGSLKTCTRIFVHSLEDVNRLREWGVTENVVLLPHGVIDRPALNADGVRSLLGLSRFNPVIGTFGFLLPGKGLPELIHGFALLLNAYPTAYLLMLNADYPSLQSSEERERCLGLAQLLGIEDRLRLINDFLDVDEILFLLGACHAIVYPYQHSDESASGAVRLGLSAGRPVLTTPLAVFADLAEAVVRLPGCEPWEISEGIISLLRDERRQGEILRRQSDWVRNNSWATQAARISNIILGCIEEHCQSRLRVPTQFAAGQPPLDANMASEGRVHHLALPPTVLDWQSKRAANGSAAALNDIGDMGVPLALTARAASARRDPWYRRNLRAKSAGAERDPAEKKLMSRADRARDSKDWVSAARYYREALDLKPDNPAAWVQYGHALKEAGDPLAAEQAYRESLHLNIQNADTHLQLGHALKIQGKKIEAGAAYLRALALDPTLDHAWAELKALGWRRGRIELALRNERGT